MSTKIFNAYCLRDASAVGVHGFFQIVSAIRADAERVREQLDAEYLVKQSLRLMDTAAFKQEELVAQPIVQAREDWEMSKNSHSDMEVFSDPHYFECSVGYDSEYDMVLVKGHYHASEKYSAVFDDLGLEDFSYWSNTDKPDSVTEAEWLFRRDRWDAMIGNNAPADSMLSMKVYSGYSGAVLLSSLTAYDNGHVHPAITTALTEAHSPQGLRDRAFAVASSLLGKPGHEVLLKKYEQEGVSTDDIDSTSFMQDTMSLLTSAFYREELNSFAGMLTSMLPRVQVHELWGDSGAVGSDGLIDYDAVNEVIEGFRVRALEMSLKG